MVSVFKYIYEINFIALPGKGLRDFRHYACLCSCGVIGPVLDSEQRLFIVNRNGAANNGNYVYAFNTGNICSGKRSLLHENTR